MIREPPRQGYDKFKPFKLVGRVVLDCGRVLNRSFTVAGIGIIPSGTVVVLVVICGRSRAFVTNRVIIDTRFWYKNRGITTENHF